MVMDMLQTELWDGVLAGEATWQAVVLIPKVVGDYRIIGLVEMVWKVVVVILNCRFTASITYHDSLHGLRAGQGTGTSTLEFKLLQQVVDMREAVLHEIFLDLHKSYYSLYRSSCLETLEAYVMETVALRLIRRYWERLQMMAQSG